MKYQWILFDADETLFHFDNFSGLKHMFAQYGIGFNEQDFEQYQNLNKPLWVEYQNHQINAEELQTRRFEYWSKKLNISTKQLNADFLDSMLEISTPLPGARELIAFLHQNNVKMGIITNGFARLQQLRLARTALDTYFPLLVISELVGVAKPHNTIFQYAYEKMGAPDKNKTLMVGDTLASDILGGNNFGFDTCWLNHNDVTCSEDITPTIEVRTLKQLLEHLMKG